MFGSARYGVVRTEPFYVAVGGLGIATIDDDHGWWSERAQDGPYPETQAE